MSEWMVDKCTDGMDGQIDGWIGRWVGVGKMSGLEDDGPVGGQTDGPKFG